jgi:hypothetical protein
MLMSIPFTEPAKYAAALADGSLVRYGALLKDSSSGHIVAHLQESGLMQSALGSAASSIFSPVSAVSSLGANVQIAHLSMMMESLQLLGFANVGVALVGVGVSAVGFKVMSDRLKVLQHDLSDLSESINLQFLELEKRSLREHCSSVQRLTIEATMASTYREGHSEWRRIAHCFSEEAGFYKGEVEHLLCLPKFNIDILASLTEMFTFCNRAKIKCLMHADELLAAKEGALITKIQYRDVFDQFSPVDLAKKTIDEDVDNYDYLLRSRMIDTKNIVTSIRDVQEVTETLPYLIDTLIEKEIPGPEFFNRLSEEKTEPILYLNAG